MPSITWSSSRLSLLPNVRLGSFLTIPTLPIGRRQWHWNNRSTRHRSGFWFRWPPLSTSWPFAENWGPKWPLCSRFWQCAAVVYHCWDILRVHSSHWCDHHATTDWLPMLPAALPAAVRRDLLGPSTVTTSHLRAQFRPAPAAVWAADTATRFAVVDSTVTDPCCRRCATMSSFFYGYLIEANRFGPGRAVVVTDLPFIWPNLIRFGPDHFSPFLHHFLDGLRYISRYIIFKSMHITRWTV